MIPFRSEEAARHECPSRRGGGARSTDTGGKHRAGCPQHNQGAAAGTSSESSKRSAPAAGLASHGLAKQRARVEVAECSVCGFKGGVELFSGSQLSKPTCDKRKCRGCISKREAQLEDKRRAPPEVSTARGVGGGEGRVIHVIRPRIDAHLLGNSAWSKMPMLGPSRCRFQYLPAKLP